MINSYERRKFRTRNKIINNNKSGRMRASVHRTNVNFYIQLFDADGKVICSCSTLSIVKKDKSSGLEMAKIVGKEFARVCIEKGIKEIVFDKGAYSYNGRVKAAAESCRAEGLKF